MGGRQAGRKANSATGLNFVCPRLPNKQAGRSVGFLKQALENGDFRRKLFGDWKKEREGKFPILNLLGRLGYDVL